MVLSACSTLLNCKCPSQYSYCHLLELLLQLALLLYQAFLCCTLLGLFSLLL